MASFTGFLAGSPRAETPAGLSASLGHAVHSLSGAWIPYVRMAGMRTLKGLVQVASRPLQGRTQHGFKELYYGRIHVVPPLIELGLIFDPKQRTVEVWNAYEQVKTCTAAPLTGTTDGVSAAAPAALPLAFGPLQSRVWTLTTGVEGSPQVKYSLGFNFGLNPAGLAEIPAAMTTATRLMVFSIRVNWEPGVRERIGYLTDVLEAWDGTEQRVQLRVNPTRGLEYEAMALDGPEAARMSALLWGWQGRAYGVPWWPDLTPLLGDLPVGAQAISAETAGRAFEPGGLVLLWRDPATFEAGSIVSVGSSVIALASPLQKAWARTGTWVLPMRAGRIDPSLRIQGLTPEAASVPVAFFFEGVP